MQIDYPYVRGYATYANAKKRGWEVEDKLKRSLTEREWHTIKWVVIALESGRFVPAFNVNNLPGGPGMLLSEVNVCTFN